MEKKKSGKQPTPTFAKRGESQFLATTKLFPYSLLPTPYSLVPSPYPLLAQSCSFLSSGR